MKTIDKKSLSLLRPLIEKELQALAEKHGIVFKVGNGSFDSSHQNGLLKLEICLVGEGGVVMTREATDFLNNAELLGMKKEWLNQEFKNIAGETYKITGLRLRGRLNVICTKLSNGGSYVFEHANIIKRMSVVTNA
jgi:hypothetical protein